MRIVITGGAGQLGMEFPLLLKNHDVWVARKEIIDITQYGWTNASLHGYMPDIIINCAAYNDVDCAENSPVHAMSVNAWAVKNLARYCNEHSVRLIHFSTDHVFGGDFDPKSAIPYTIDDPPCPVNNYGISKLAGECLARAYHDDSIIIRTCGLYGNYGQSGKASFPSKILALAAAGKPIQVVHDQVCTPTYTRDLANMVLEVINNELPAGIYHATNAGCCSWYDFATTLLHFAGQDAHVVPVTTEYSHQKRNLNRAPRPRYSVLRNNWEREVTPQQATRHVMRPWHEALVEYLEERKRLQKQEY
jgi:dTDP-4-dehydrorhamnose reductase